MPNTQNISILLDIVERLGSIEAKLEANKHLEDKIEKQLDDLDKRTDALEKFESRIAAYIWIGGSVVSGVLFFLWEGLKYLLPKDAVTRFFHG